MSQVFAYWSYPPWRHPRPAAAGADPGPGARWPFAAGPVAVVGLSLAALGLCAVGIAATGLVDGLSAERYGNALARPPAHAPGPDRVALQHAAVRGAAGVAILVALRIAGRSREGLAVLAAIAVAALAVGEGLLRVDAVRAVALVDLPGAADATLTAAAETSFRIVVVAGWLATLGYALLALPSRGAGLAPARLAEKRRLLVALTAATAAVLTLAPAAAWLGTVARVAETSSLPGGVEAAGAARLGALSVTLAAVHAGLATPALAVRAVDGRRAGIGSGRAGIAGLAAACGLPLAAAALAAAG